MTRTIVVTGGSSGVGLAAAEQLAALGDQVVVVGRDPGRLAAAVERVRAAGNGREPLSFRADFEQLSSVRELASFLLESCPVIDVLANNAGGLISKYRRTPDGFEATIQSNHLAPFLLTNLLRERLRGARVINTSSAAHRRKLPDPGDFTASSGRYRGFPVYGAAKAANILFTAEAARRWPDITSVSFHPGLVRTNFGEGVLVRALYKYAPGMISPEQAGALLTWLATTDELVDGAYYVGHEVTPPIKGAQDARLAAELWVASEKATGI